MKKEKILVSACLLGIPCRWHGKKIYFSSFVRKYIKQRTKDGCEIEVISVCPELLGGLEIPRSPVKRKKGRVFKTCEDKKMRRYITGEELTMEFNIGAEETLKIVKKENIKKAILCKWSPSCDASGITGSLLRDNGITIINTF